MVWGLSQWHAASYLLVLPAPSLARIRLCMLLPRASAVATGCPSRWLPWSCACTRSIHVMEGETAVPQVRGAEGAGRAQAGGVHTGAATAGRLWDDPGRPAVPGVRLFRRRCLSPSAHGRLTSSRMRYTAACPVDCLACMRALLQLPGQGFVCRGELATRGATCPAARAGGALPRARHAAHLRRDLCGAVAPGHALGLATARRAAGHCLLCQAAHRC